MNWRLRGGYDRFARIPLRNVRIGLRNLWRWLPIVWRYRNWDWSYMTRVQAYMLRDLAAACEGVFVGSEAEVKRMLYVAEILEREARDDDDELLRHHLGIERSTSFTDQVKLDTLRRLERDSAYRTMARHLTSWWS